MAVPRTNTHTARKTPYCQPRVMAPITPQVTLNPRVTNTEYRVERLISSTVPCKTIDGIDTFLEPASSAKLSAGGLGVVLAVGLLFAGRSGGACGV
jgi:hypothetical protein